MRQLTAKWFSSTAEIIFHVKRLTQSEWNYIFKLSFPIIILEEIMKAVTRCLSPIPPSLGKLAFTCSRKQSRVRDVRVEGAGGDL
jgi:hypothetical protein